MRNYTNVLLGGATGAPGPSGDAIEVELDYEFGLCPLSLGPWFTPCLGFGGCFQRDDCPQRFGADHA